MISIGAVLHFSEYLPVLDQIVPQVPLLRLSDVHRILFLIPIIYAAYFRGPWSGVFVVAVALLVFSPEVFQDWREGEVEHALAETTTVGVVGLAASWVVARLKKAEEEVTYLAFHDVLTGLPNRALFRDRLDMALAHARRSNESLAVIIADLDRFKFVNDTYGHDTGDQLLQAVSVELMRNLREGDTVARIGGDEFTMLLPTISESKDVDYICERIQKSLRRPFMLGSKEFTSTASIGIAIYPNDGEDAETLIKNADIAMYHAKWQGRDNCRRYDPETMQSQPRTMRRRDIVESNYFMQW
jgi:diguanylate cyclase (GGDEF)-like protein